MDLEVNNDKGLLGGHLLPQSVTIWDAFTSPCQQLHAQLSWKFQKVGHESQNGLVWNGTLKPTQFQPAHPELSPTGSGHPGPHLAWTWVPPVMGHYSFSGQLCQYLTGFTGQDKQLHVLRKFWRVLSCRQLKVNVLTPSATCTKTSWLIGQRE